MSWTDPLKRIGLQECRRDSILGEATEAGELTGATDYGPFGEQITQTQEPDPADPLAGQSFGYLGAHARAGLYASEQIHMGARIYDPQSGRFISRDPLPGNSINPQTQNPYAYGLGSPGRYYDLDGRIGTDAGALTCFIDPLQPVCWVGAVGVTTTVVGVLWAKDNSEEISDATSDAVEAISKDQKTKKDDEGGSESGQTNPGNATPNLGNLKRVSDREIKKRVGDVHKYKSEILDTKKNLKDWDVYRDGQSYYLRNKKTGAIVPAD